VLAEHKAPVYDNGRPAADHVIDAAGRPPTCSTRKIHHNNLLNSILAKMQANAAGRR